MKAVEVLGCWLGMLRKTDGRIMVPCPLGGVGIRFSSMLSVGDVVVVVVVTSSLAGSGDGGLISGELGMLSLQAKSSGCVVVDEIELIWIACCCCLLNR